MKKKSQSVISRFIETRKIERAIRHESKKYLRECGSLPAGWQMSRAQGAL